MNKIMKVSGVVVSIMLAGSVTMADGYRGDRGRGDYDRGGSRGHSDYRGDRGGHYDGGRSSYRGYSDRGRECGYYRNSGGDLVFGLIGLGIIAAAVNRPVYVQQPVYVQPEPRVVYVQPQPQVVYVQQAVYVQPEPRVVYVQQPVYVPQPVYVQTYQYSRYSCR